MYILKMAAHEDQSRKQTVLLCIIVLYFMLPVASLVHYEPTWDSLDSRTLPSWYDEAKIGIFIHWGVFSVPSFASEWFWWYWKGQPVHSVVEYMKNNYPPDFTYADFAPKFTAEFYNPDQWVDLFNASGARYIVLITKHHEGFTNWPSNHSFNWNAMDVGPKMDLVGMLANSIRKRTDIRLGLYHSLFEWFNPLFLQDKANKFATNYFVTSKTMPELYELVNTYKPDIVWSDGDDDGLDTYWNSKEFLAWLYNDSPVKDTVVTNDRWGANCGCKHGGYLTCMDRYNPGKLQQRKWENAMTLDKSSWGYRREATLEDFLTVEELITLIVETVSCGGNILINVGPTKDGRITPIYEERLRQMGQWLKVNGEAIYETKPWTSQNDTVAPNVWYTSKKSETGTRVYAFVLKWPETDILYLGSPSPSSSTRVTLLGYSSPIPWRKPASQPSGIELLIPVISVNTIPCQWAWVFMMENLAN